MKFLRWLKTVPGNVATMRPHACIAFCPWTLGLGVELLLDGAPGWHFDSFLLLITLGPWVFGVGIIDSN